MRKRSAITIAAAIGLLAAPALADEVLYGIDVPGNLFTIDVTTGAATFVGILPDGPWGVPKLPGYNEVEYDNSTGRAWAQQRDGNFAAQEFDIATAAGIGGPVPNQASWHGLEYVGGTLYAAGFAGPFGPPSLATLDPATGVFAVIGALGSDQMTGLAYDDPGGIMFGITGGKRFGSSLYTINLTTGAATLVGDTRQTFGSLQFGPDDNLYAGGVGSIQGDLYRIDPGTGAAAFVGATGFGTGPQNGLSGLTLLIPEPVTLNLLALGGLFALGRRR